MTDNNPQNSSNEPLKLSWPDAVRLRPGMYFGGVDSASLHQLIVWLINHAVDESLAAQHRQIDITIEDNHILTIADYGVELSLASDPVNGEYILEQALTARNKLPRSENQPYLNRHRSYLLAWVNAGSAEFDIQIKQNGFLWTQQYKQGVKQTELIQARPLLSDEANGTTISFQPDFAVFQPCEFDYELISRRCRELALLLSNFTIEVKDQRSTYPPRNDTFFFSSGLKQYVEYLNRDYTALHDPVVARQTVELRSNYKPLGYTADIEIAIQFTELPQPILLGYVNAFGVEHGGTHIRGLIEGIDHVTTDFAWKLGVGGAYTFTREDLVCGLSAIVSIWHSKPEFEGSMNYRLMNPELSDAVYKVTRDALEAFAAEHPDQMKRIIDKCSQNKALREHRQYGMD